MESTYHSQVGSSERQALYDELLAMAYEGGLAVQKDENANQCCSLERLKVCLVVRA